MERVWRELYRKKRGSNKFLNPVERKGSIARITQLAGFSHLYTIQNSRTSRSHTSSKLAWFFAAARLPLMTQDKLNSHIKPYTIMASRLRKDAEGLRAFRIKSILRRTLNPLRSVARNSRSRARQTLYSFVALCPWSSDHVATT